MRVRQFTLTTPVDEDNIVITTAWLDANAGLKRGSTLTLKNDDRIWTITQDSGIETNLDQIETQWNVGGVKSTR